MDFLSSCQDYTIFADICAITDFTIYESCFVESLPLYLQLFVDDFKRLAHACWSYYGKISAKEIP